jgi:hypothetical protein
MVVLPVWVILVLALIGTIVILVLLGQLQKQKDMNSEIEKTIVIYATVSAVILGGLGVSSYIYFTYNIEHSTPFIIIMSFINTFLSIVALASSTQQVIHS